MTTPGKPKKGDALRVNDRFQVIDEGFATRLWEETGLRNLVLGEGRQEGEEGMSVEELRELWYARNLFSYLMQILGRVLTGDRGGEVIGLNPSIRVYRYTKGQFFDCHCKEPFLFPLSSFSFCLPCHVQFLHSCPDDESNHLNLSNTPAKTTWTLLLYLTSLATGCQGGETVFYPDEIVIPGKKNVVEKEIVVELETGMALLHKHGNDCMLVSGLFSLKM